MNRNIKWSPESPQQIECERRLLMTMLNWMFDDLQPYTVVENSQFQGFVASLNIKFDVPNSTGKSSVLCNNQCLQFLEEPSFALLYMMWYLVIPSPRASIHIFRVTTIHFLSTTTFTEKLSWLDVYPIILHTQRTPLNQESYIYSGEMEVGRR